MSRLYKKCVVASSGLHVLLAVILVVCPAFLAPKPKLSDVQPITFFPDILTPSAFAGGGNPDAGRPAPPTPAPPAPAPPPTRTATPPEPKPPVREVEPPKTKGESLEVTKDKKNAKKKPEVSLTEVTRNPNAKQPTRDTTAADEQAREDSARRDRVRGVLDRTLGSISSGTGRPTRLDGSFGPGGGGPSYAGYGSWVWSYFDRAWVRPEDATIDDATVEVRVTIASDGTVSAKRIIKRSGDAAVDASVERLLDKVTTVGRPFPEGMNETEHTYIIPFIMKIRRGTA